MAITERSSQSGNISRLIVELDNHDGLKRKKAHFELVAMGSEAVPALIRALSSPHEHTRWEAAKALGQIADKSAAVALVDSLEDDSLAVRWAAAESLVSLRRASVIPLLQAMVKCYDSLWLREGAHHVLHVLKQSGQLEKLETKVFEALEGPTPTSEVPWAAWAAIEALQGS